MIPATDMPNITLEVPFRILENFTEAAKATMETACDMLVDQLRVTKNFKEDEIDRFCDLRHQRRAEDSIDLVRTLLSPGDIHDGRHYKILASAEATFEALQDLVHSYKDELDQVYLEHGSIERTRFKEVAQIGRRIEWAASCLGLCETGFRAVTDPEEEHLQQLRSERREVANA